MKQKLMIKNKQSIDWILMNSIVLVLRFFITVTIYMWTFSIELITPNVDN
jgi:hypothetical protein